MADIVLHHGSGAHDFEVLGSAMEPAALKRILFNARRLLNASGKADAIAVLDSAPFSIFSATNHFNDDFCVLRAEVHLSDYETFRLTGKEKRWAAAELAAAIKEADGPYIRFISIGLVLSDPEEWDVFLSHASEDKTEIARPIYQHLESNGVHCWFDEAEIAWGESIVSKVQEGLSLARFVIVVLTPHFIRKPWTQKELRAALTLEIEGNRGIVLPLLAGNPAALLSELPFLKEKRYLTWSGDAGLVERELRTLIRRKSGPAQ